jgi:hypothetical protein
MLYRQPVPKDFVDREYDLRWEREFASRAEEVAAYVRNSFRRIGRGPIAFLFNTVEQTGLTTPWTKCPSSATRRDVAIDRRMRLFRKRIWSGEFFFLSCSTVGSVRTLSKDGENWGANSVGYAFRRARSLSTETLLNSGTR